MRAASRIHTILGSTALLAAMLLASPGVRVSRAEQDVSHDPALEQSVQPPAKASDEVTSGPLCEAGPAPVMGPLRGLPILPVEGEEELNSLNGRGYNIGATEPTFEMQRLMFEVKRKRQPR